MGLEVIVTGDSVAWEWRGSAVRIPQSVAPRTACYVEIPPCVVIVEGPDGGSRSNAVVYDLDGTERIRLLPPEVADPIGFDQVFVGRDGVTAVFASRSLDLHGHPDLDSGATATWSEWR